MLASLLLAAVTFPMARRTGFVGDSPGAVWLWLSVEVTGIAAVLAVGRWESAAGGATLVRLLALSWGATAVGMVHQLFEYAFMITTNDSNWDVPPGTGYGTSAVLGVSAVLTASACLRRDRPARPRPPAPPPVQTVALPSSTSPGLELTSALSTELAGLCRGRRPQMVVHADLRPGLTHQLSALVEIGDAVA